MPDASTTNYSWTLPEVGAADETWGDSLNANWTDLDTELKAVSDVADAALVATSYTAADVLAKLLTVDGTGTGLDADLLRGVTPSTIGLAILADADAAAIQTEIGLVPGTDVQAYDAGLADIAGLAVTDGNFIVGDGANWVAEGATDARASLGLGALAVKGTVNNDDWSGADLAVANGGTGGSTQNAAQQGLGVEVGVDVQAHDDGLDAIAALTPTNSYMIVGNGSTWVRENGSTLRASIGLGSAAVEDAATGATVSTVAKRTTSGDLNAVDFNATSDRRMKSNIVELDGMDAITALRGIAGYTFELNDREQIGVIAQELQGDALLTRIVHPDRRTGFLNVAYNGLIGVLVSAVKELDGRLAAVEHGGD